MRLILVDATGIQGYVFASNRLKDNIGASYLVEMASTSWAKRACAAARGDWIFGGGGNAMATFGTAEAAKWFVRDLSRICAVKAPGLHLAFGAVDYDGNIDAGVVKGAFIDVAKRKQALDSGCPCKGLPFVRRCSETGLNASVRDPREDAWISYETSSKRKAARAANAKLRQDVGVALGEDLIFPERFEDLADDLHERSRVAVIHVDGNGVGKRVQAAIGGSGDPAEMLGSISEGIRKAGIAAMIAALKPIASAVDRPVARLAHRNWNSGSQLPAIKLRRGSGDNLIFPLRPLVYGGDDTTVICDERIAMTFVLNYLHAYRAATRELQAIVGELTASAGICMAPRKYPFSRLYSFSEQLCSSAKESAKEQVAEGEPLQSSFDWHIAYGELNEDLFELRSLVMKKIGEEAPQVVRLTSAPLMLSEWTNLAELAEDLQQPDWQSSRNKLKSIRGVLRKPDQTARAYYEIYLNKEQRKKQGISNLFDPNDRTAVGRLADAIDLMELWLPLRQEPLNP